MNQITSHIQNGCRAVLRPFARALRAALTPAEPPTVFDWHTVESGPATGAQLILPKGKAITESITTGVYEEQTLAIVSSLVAETDVCFDIGGHYGYYTMSLAKLAPRGEVHTFEPVPTHAERISDGAKRSQFDHVTVHRCAVAAAIGEMTLRMAGDDGDDSMAFLDDYGGVDTPSAHEQYGSFTRTTVKTITLDSLVGEIALPRFIKIDAEGAEGPILASGQHLIAQSRPRMLIELHGIYEAIECAEILSHLDYRAILLTDQKTTMPILWAPRDDRDALDSVRKVLGRDPVTLFDDRDSGSSSSERDQGVQP